MGIPVFAGISKIDNQLHNKRDSQSSIAEIRLSGDFHYPSTQQV
jgi:hypothetical protein